MRALVDADIVCYEFGAMKDLGDGSLLPWAIVRSFVDERIEYILDAVGATEHSLYLTNSKSNFRNEVATILPYKGHRPTEKPHYWQDIREHLVDNYDAEVIYGMEADDKCGIEQSQAYQKSEEDFSDGLADFEETLDTVICSRDKDLHMIPGWHYSWPCGNQKERKWYVNETDGIRFFYKQLLTGDATDNILGLYRVGEKANCVRALDNLEDELDMYELVFKEYNSRFGSYASKFLEENARLLWMLRTEDNHEVIDKLMWLSVRWEETRHEEKEKEEQAASTDGQVRGK